MSQGHADNLRDLILNYELDKTGNNVIDFTFGKGSLWKSKYEYRLNVVRCDAQPSEGEDIPRDIHKLDVTKDDYSGLPRCVAGVFDPPYKYTPEVFDYGDRGLKSMQKQGKNSWGSDDKFSYNESEDAFIERVRGCNRAALQCMKKGSLLFAKVMDIRDGKGRLVLNHLHMINHLTAFECYAIFVYMAGGSKTFKNHAELSHGYWLVFRMIQDPEQMKLNIG